MEPWLTIATAVLGNTAALAVLGWLGKSLLEKMLQRDSKRFEMELKAKADSAIEKLRSDLQLRTIEHQITFSQLQKKRATVIANLNALLAETLWESEYLLSRIRWAGEPSEREKYQVASNKLVEFFRYYDKHRIYLPAELCTMVEQLVLEVRSHVEGFGAYLIWDDAELQEHVRKEKSDALLAGCKVINDHVPDVRKKLEEEFRLLLGPRT